MLRQCFVTLIVLSFAGLAGAEGPQQDLQLVKNPTNVDSYTVIYTGRLFGYYRFPEVEVTQLSKPDGSPAGGIDSCFGDITSSAAPEAFRFQEGLSLAANGSKGTTLRVAAGDNFSPFLLSRQMWNPVKRQLVEKEKYVGLNGAWAETLNFEHLHPAEYIDILNGGGSIPMDNVGCFIRRMGFDAIVPGQFDFYFGPARVRQLGHFLADSIPGHPELPATKMLGVNLFLQTKEVTTSVSQSAAPSANGPKGPPLIPATTLPTPPRITTPKTALPWMRSVQVQDWPPAGAAPKACIVDVKRLTAIKPLASYTPADELRICDSPEFALTPQAASVSLGHTLTITGPQVLQWDTDYAVAIVLPQASGPNLAAWQTFTAVPPFFGYAPGKSMVADADKPWLLKSEGGMPVAVFGIVDPNLMQFIGRYNSVWLEEEQNNSKFPVNDHYETDLQVADPAEALKQALEYCNMFPDCAGARKVLLAQMPQQTAYDMLASFHAPGLQANFEQEKVDSKSADRGNFDLVIAEADPERGSGNRVTVRMPDGDMKEFSDPVVVVPDPGALFSFGNPGQIKVRLQRAIVTPGDFSASDEPRVVRNLPIHPANDTVPTDWFPANTPVHVMIESGNNLLYHLNHLKWGTELAVKNTKLDNLAANPPAEIWVSGLQQLALKALARVCRSDAAMVQQRDIFFVDEKFTQPPLTKGGFQAVMDAIFWKGDYVQCMSASGSTITSVLQRSKDLQQRQFYGLLADASLDKDWSLVTLGANEDQPDATRRLISRQLLDPKKLYSIGVTDFIGNGDTGYPALQGAEPPPQTPWSKTRLRLLADAITFQAGNDAAEDVLDTLTRVPLVPPSELHMPDTTFLSWFRSFFTGLDTISSPDPLQKSIESRPIWSISLYKADFSYSMAAHSGLERTVPVEFPGVSAVDLTAQDSSSITFDFELRVQRDLGDNEFYFQPEMNYGYKKTRQASKSVPAGSTAGDPYSRNQPADFVYGELGYARRIHFHPKKANPYGWKIQAPLGIQTQLSPSISLPEGVSGPSGQPSFVVKSPRSYYVEGRPGLRWDYSFPKPADWSMGQGGGAGQSAGSGAQSSGSGGGGGKGGKGGSSSQSSSNAQSGGGSSGGGGSQTQTFDSYLEFGYQFGPSKGGPKDFVFNDPNGWLTTLSPTNPANVSGSVCQPQSPVGTLAVVTVANVVDCFNAAAQTVPTSKQYAQPYLNNIVGGRTHFQNGLYFNYRIDMPVPIPQNQYTVFSNMEIVSELRGDFFFGHSQDTPVDTHFLLDAKQSLNIPIFSVFSGKVSLAPTVEMIYYTNKISNNLYRSYSTSVSLTYSFDMRKGLSFPKVLGYQNPVPSLPTLPSR